MTHGAAGQTATATGGSAAEAPATPGGDWEVAPCGLAVRWARRCPWRSGESKTREYVEIAAEPEAVRLARAQARDMLTGWGCEETAGGRAVVLVVSELVTNAMQAMWVMGTRQIPVRLWLARLPDAVRVLVWDASMDAPVAQAAPAGEIAEDEAGRGLQVVAALSTAQGWYYSGMIGKAVWADIALDELRESEGG
jgi:anti-sigma regulatory factor (Ser/Thr protein kinase)